MRSCRKLLEADAICENFSNRIPSYQVIPDLYSSSQVGNDNFFSECRINQGQNTNRPYSNFFNKQNTCIFKWLYLYLMHVPFPKIFSWAICLVQKLPVVQHDEGHLQREINHAGVMFLKNKIRQCLDFRHARMPPTTPSMLYL